MPNPNKAHLIALLDRSGSMNIIRDDTIGGMNTLVEEQRKHPGECTFTLVQFDNEYEMVYSFVPLDKVEPRSHDNYIPRGGTALLDAIGRAVVSEGEALAKLDEADRPGLVVLAILTDGQENASREYTREQISTMLEHQQEVYGWQVTYLSADANAFHDAATYGIKQQSVAKFTPNNIGQAASGLASSVLRGRLATSRGASPAQAMAYTNEEKSAMVNGSNGN